MNIIASKVAIVKLGTIEIEGLLFEDGRFGVAVQQVASLFQLPQNNVQRDIKTLLGKGFQFLTTKTNRAVRQNRAEKAIDLVQFETLVLELTIKGNKTSVSLSRALTGLALTQLFAVIVLD